MRDPMPVVRIIYSQLGIPLSATAESRMERYLADNPKGKNGSHRYALESFGLHADSLGRRFKSYCEYFGVPAESPAHP